MWQWYALIAMACFAGMQLVFRYLGNQGIDSAGVLLVVFAFGAVLYLAHVRLTRTPVPATWPVVLGVVLAVVRGVVRTAIRSPG